MYDLVPHNRAVGPASRCFLVISRASMCRFDDVDKFPHCVVCGTSQLLSRSLLLSFFISLPASIPPSSSPICPPIPPTRPGGMREAIEYLYIYIYIYTKIHLTITQPTSAPPLASNRIFYLSTTHTNGPDTDSLGSVLPT